MPSDWCGRSWLYSCRQASTPACASSIEANGPAPVRKSVCRVWCQRSTLPMVVGEYGLVSRCLIPFLRQIRSNNTSAGRGLPNRPVNTFPLNIGQHTIRDPIQAHRGHKRPAHRPGSRPAHHRGDHTEPGTVIDAGDQFQFGAVGQKHRPGDIELPQLHRLLALPAFVILAAAFALPGRDQAMAHQHPVDGGSGRHRAHPRPAQLEQQPPRTPPRVRPPPLADQRLNPRVQLARLIPGPVGMIGQPR